MDYRKLARNASPFGARMDSAAPEGRLNKPSDMQITFRYRVKDKHAALLAKQAAAVNYVWNFLQRDAN